MTSAILCGGKISTAFANTRRRRSMMNNIPGSNSASHTFGFRFPVLWAIGKTGEDPSNCCYLSADKRNLYREAIVCRRKPIRNVTYCLAASDCNAEPCDLEEFPHDFVANIADESILEQDNCVNGVSESVFRPSNQVPPQNVKQELIMLFLPAIASQAMDSMSLLMETAYIDRLGLLELASASISLSIFNIISKLFNMPLLNVATSFVAEDIANSSPDGRQGFKRKQLSSVSTALILAIGIGIVEALLLLSGTGSFLTLMGISHDSPMRVPAEKFLSIRALGTPAVVLSLALQGVLRGFKDTKTPLFCLGVGNLTAVFLFPLLMNKFQMGIVGAAIATVVSQYIGSFLMLWHLSKRVVLLPPTMVDLKFGAYLKSGGFLIVRTLAELITMAIGTSMAAREGPRAMAAHQICLRMWMSVSLLTDVLAASGQALIATYLSSGDYKRVKEITNFLLKIGILIGCVSAVIFESSFESLANLFTKDSAVSRIVLSGSLFVSASQPFNVLAYIFDGLHYGVSDFRYAAFSMMLAGLISSAIMLNVLSETGLSGVWLGLALFMGSRTAAGHFRILSKSGPWRFLHRDSQQTGIHDNLWLIALIFYLLALLGFGYFVLVLLALIDVFRKPFFVLFSIIIGPFMSFFS